MVALHPWWELTFLMRGCFTRLTTSSAKRSVFLISVVAAREKDPLEIMLLPQIHSERQAKQGFALVCPAMHHLGCPCPCGLFPSSHSLISFCFSVLRLREGRKPREAMRGLERLSYLWSNKGNMTIGKC